MTELYEKSLRKLELDIEFIRFNLDAFAAGDAGARAFFHAERRLFQRIAVNVNPCGSRNQLDQFSRTRFGALSAPHAEFRMNHGKTVDDFDRSEFTGMGAGSESDAAEPAVF